MGVVPAASIGKDQERIDVGQIGKSLVLGGAHWKAAPNWLTELSREKLQQMMGSLEHPGLLDVTFQGEGRMGALAAPTAFDWRANNGVNFVSPLLNQGNCGSCVSFAAIATLETQLNIAGGAGNILNPKLSTQALFACGGGSCDSGWYPSSAASYLKNTGVPDEACAPYTMGATGADVSCSSICADSRARNVKTLRTIQPSGIMLSRDDVKAALTRGPLMTTLTVYDDFVTYKSGIYRHTTGGYLGGHAVSIIGYNDQGGYWIIRNSWGSDWGENGFARVSYNDSSGVGQSTWGFEVAASEGFLKIENPDHRQFLSGMTEIRALSTFDKVEELKLVVRKPGGSSMMEETCSTQTSSDVLTCRPTVNTAALADGEYEVQAVGMRKDGKITSQPNRFFVTNHAQTLSVVFTGRDVDLTRPLKDRIEFILKISSGAAPLSRLVFHAKKLGDQIQLPDYTKETTLVLSDMSMGWRTPAVVNGDYEIWFVGEQPQNGTLQSMESAHLRVKVAN